MDRIIKNYEEPVEKEVSLKTTFKHLRHRRNVKKLNKIGKKLDKINGTEHNHGPEVQQQPMQQQVPVGNLPPSQDKLYHFAIIIDDLVIDVMHVYEGFADVLRNSPKFVELGDEIHPQQGSLFKGNEFIPFDKVLQDASPTFRGGG